MGDTNYFDYGDGVLVFGVAVFAFVFAAARVIGFAALLGWVGLAVTGFTFFRALNLLSQMRVKLAEDDIPFRTALGDAIQMGFAWPVLLTGALMLMVSGFMKDKEERQPVAPKLAKARS